MKKYDHLIEDLRGCLVEYMAQKGYVVRGRHKMIRCLNPDHQDDTPSMSYYAKAQQMHCFGCGANYDLFDLIGLDYPECDTFPKRVRMACSLFGREYPADFAAQESGSGKPATKKNAAGAPYAQSKRIGSPGQPAAGCRRLQRNGGTGNCPKRRRWGILPKAGD